MEKNREDEEGKRNHIRVTKPEVYEKVAKFAEKRANGESIAIIQLQYRYTCNMWCSHCSVEQIRKQNSTRKMLTPDDVRKLSDEAHSLGLARFVITGGEPLVFPDLEEVVKAIGPRHFINMDTNGYLLSRDKVRWLKEIGIDRVQLSIDNLFSGLHDSFRKKPESYVKAAQAHRFCKEEGMEVFVQTVVDRDRLYSPEFEWFIQRFNIQGTGVFVTFLKPVGGASDKAENMITREDLKYFNQLEQQYKVCNHLTPGYGLNMGCIAVKGMISITPWGDVLPCPYAYISLGNILEQPLAECIENGFKIKWFRDKLDYCPVAMDKEWCAKYLPKPEDVLPKPWKECFSEGDYV